jgi:hypothetical protein
LLARKQRKTWKMGTKGQRSALLMTCWRLTTIRRRLDEQISRHES